MVLRQDCTRRPLLRDIKRHAVVRRQRSLSFYIHVNVCLSWRRHWTTQNWIKWREIAPWFGCNPVFLAFSNKEELIMQSSNWVCKFLCWRLIIPFQKQLHFIEDCIQSGQPYSSHLMILADLWENDINKLNFKSIKYFFILYIFFTRIMNKNILYSSYLQLWFFMVKTKEKKLVILTKKRTVTFWFLSQLTI